MKKMKQTPTRRLALSRATLRQLSASQLETARGGKSELCEGASNAPTCDCDVGIYAPSLHVCY